MSTYFSGADAGTYPGYYGPGGSVTVGASAELLGVTYGISMAGAGIVYNFGIVEGGSIGIDLAGGGSVTNAIGGTIDAPLGIHISGGFGYVTNDGEIGDGTGTGIYLGAGGTVSNIYHGVISGTIGVEIGPGAPGTLVNDSTIDGSLYSVRLDSGTDVLVLEGGSKLVGAVVGGGGTLELGAGDGPGTLAGLGSISREAGYRGFSTYLVQANADWTLAGTNTPSGSLMLGDDSTLVVAGVLSTSEVDWTGCAIEVNPGGVFSLDEYNRISDIQSLINDGKVAFYGTLIVENSISGDGIFEIEPDATLGLAGGFAGAIYFVGENSAIDLTSVTYSSADVVTYEPGGVTITDGTTTVATFALSREPAGTVFAVQPDGNHGTILFVEKSAGHSGLVTDAFGLETALINEGLEALSTYVEQSENVPHAGLNFFTPPSLFLPGGTQPPIAGDVNIENGITQGSGKTIQLSAGIQGAVISGYYPTTLLGDTGTELLVGGEGKETIRAAGGSGTVISGQGQSVIYTGRGDVIVCSGGDDTIYTGKSGFAQVTALRNATVHAGGGFTTFTDSGIASSADKVKGGTGTTIMNSGIGQDTFVGGSGTSFMNDTGPGRVALVFNKGTGGTDIVTGFDPSNGDYIRTTAISNGWSEFEGNISVIGGSSFVNLADGTKIEFVGFTSLSAADFHA